MELEDNNQFEIEEGLDQHYQAMKELGDCYTALLDFDQARECYRQAATLAPDAPGPYVGLGVIAIQAEQLQDARAAFEVARKLDANCAEAYGGLAMIHQQQKDHQAAFEMYLRCLELDIDNLVALLGLFQTSCQMGTFCKIIHYLEAYLDRHPGDTSVLFCLASLYAKEGRLDEARQSLQTVLILEPDKSQAADLLTEIEQELARMQPQEIA